MHQDLYYDKTMQPKIMKIRCIILSRISRMCEKKIARPRGFLPSNLIPREFLSPGCNIIRHLLPWFLPVLVTELTYCYIIKLRNCIRKELRCTKPRSYVRIAGSRWITKLQCLR